MEENRVRENKYNDNIIEERFILARERVEEIAKYKDSGAVAAESFWTGSKFFSYFCETAVYIGKLLTEWDRQEKKEDEMESLDILRERNRALYVDILPGNYEKCYGNPSYTVSLYGEEMGRLLAFLYGEIHSQIESVYEREKEELLIHMELFLEVYQAFTCAFSESQAEPACEEIREIVYWFVSDYSEPALEKRVRKQLDPENDFFLRIVMERDLKDLRYLYAYGEYITENEEKLASYLNGLPEEKIARMADTFTEGYRIGFLVGGKDIAKKKTVNIRYTAGFERVVRRAVENFERMGLRTVIYRASTSILYKRGAHRIGFYGAEANKQFLYDHREDEALFLDRKMMHRRLEELRAAYEAAKELAFVHGGPACIEAFGEIPFVPENKQEASALSEKQQQLSVEYAAESGQIVNEYIKGEERSFTMIAFPVPQIGEQFPEIFDAVIDINTLDYNLYQKMQQTMIDTLDRASHIRIRGRDGNRSDLVVALRPLQNPEKETAFENCVADVNIPVGEVFTSPQLEGTNGCLHVKRVFLNGLEYKDLELVFTDGMITSYRCGNFESEEENRKYIKDNILFHHESLPMGEFAIGTNTTAYVAARKYGIADKLPILIAEKTGPHFAVGDTCYSHSEDLPVYNPDGKEIVARDNAISIQRLTDREKTCYFHCHTDITIPYDELGELTAVSSEGEWPIIENGRFVLDGCEDLNLPLESV